MKALENGNMRILFLGGNLALELADWLKANGEDVFYLERKINITDVKTVAPDIIVSYNYKYIIPKEILELVDMQAINLHISYLPWNRGSHPNVWSFLDDTPKGVTIHYIDEGIDTGNIIVQKEVVIDEQEETLATSYVILHNEIQDLFKLNWAEIRAKKVNSFEQQNSGSFHYKKDEILFLELIKEKKWDTKISTLKEKYRQKRSQGILPADHGQSKNHI